MLQFNIPDEDYVLSVDNLDFDFMCQYFLMPTEVRRPLWSTPHEDSAYYQVTIASELTEEESFIEPCKSYMCYICNVDVPEKYYKQHNKSERHQTHKILTEKILENVAKQINVDIDTSNNNYENDEFYCETCCKVVAVKHKRKHKKSNYHLESIKKGQLTSKFLELYISNKSPESDSETDNDYKIKEDSECSSASDNTSLNKSASDNTVLNKSASDNTVLNKSASVNTVLNKSVSDNAVLNKSVLDNNGLDFRKLYDGLLNIRDTNDSKVVHTNDFNTDTESTRNEYIMAQVLANIIKNNDNVPSSSPYYVGDIFKHFKMYLDKIIEVYNLPCNMPIFEDNSVVIVTPKGYREYISIDHFHGYLKEGKHVFCQLCQMWVQDFMKEHEYSRQHATLLMQPVNDKFARILDVKYSHCLLCNTRVLTASNHTAKSLKHRNYPESIPASSPNHEEPSTSTEKPLPKTSPRKDQGQQKFIAYKKQFCYLNECYLKCLVCSVSVDTAISSMITHVEGSPHLKKCDDLLKNYNIKQLSFELYFCEVCNANILDFLGHIKMHKQVKSYLVKGKGNKFLFKKFVYEEPLNDDPIAQKYREIYVEQLLQNKIVPKEEFKYYCNVCFLNLTRISEIDHMFGERHKNHLKRNQNF